MTKLAQKLGAQCQRCSQEVLGAAKFCPHCGWDLSKPNIRYHFSGKGALLVLVSTAALWAIPQKMQSTFAGSKPTQVYTQAEQGDTEWDLSSDQELQKLKADIEKSGHSLESLREYARALVDRMREMQKPPSALLYEAMDVMTSILKAVPDDPDALASMGDIAFNQQIFDKAVFYYQAYLRKKTDDHPIRARLASALTFLGKGDEALKELQYVLSQKPNDFHALAYTSITYAQMGKRNEAMHYGELALAHAPTDEARERFQGFLASLKSETPSKAPQSASNTGNASALNAQLSEFLTSNPVAGPKFVRVDDSGQQTIAIYFRDFPMSAMPDFARKKFLDGIAAKARELGAPKERPIILYDEASKSELARVMN
ncbi:MAG: hypothetical protein K1X79_00205 [Oligoflexia bacterium]|nr:hypothetical protein [Oligoflexia bacterium]